MATLSTSTIIFNYDGLKVTNSNYCDESPEINNTNFCSDPSVHGTPYTYDELPAQDFGPFTTHYSRITYCQEIINQPENANYSTFNN